MNEKKKIYKIFIETIGCQMNLLDSELLINNLKKKKYTFTENYKDSDIIILNTCSIRESSENKIFNRINLFIKEREKKNSIKIGIIGCMVEKEEEKLIKNKEINFILGPGKIFEVINIIERLINNKKKNKEKIKDNLYINKINKIATNKIKNNEYFIKINKGCNNRCAYCVVPKVRGKEINKSPYEIINEIKNLEKLGVKEISLIGQTVNNYIYKSFNKIYKFSDLIYDIEKKTKNILRIKFLTNYPKKFDKNILNLIKESDKLIHLIYMPAQSGSNKILKLMKRNYSIEEYKEIIEEIKKEIKEVSIISDFIVGFPGEKKEDFLQTYNLIKTMKFKKIYLFNYSERKNTYAFDNYKKTVSEEVKKKRFNKILKLQNSISNNLKFSMIGKEFKAFICEEKKENFNVAKLINDYKALIKIEEKDIGKIKNIKIKEIKNKILYAEKI